MNVAVNEGSLLQEDRWEENGVFESRWISKLWQVNRRKIKENGPKVRLKNARGK